MNPSIEAVIAHTLIGLFRLGEKQGFVVVENDRRYSPTNANEKYETEFAARVERLIVDIVAGFGMAPTQVDAKGLALEIAPKLINSRLRSHEELRSVLIR